MNNTLLMKEYNKFPRMSRSYCPCCNELKNTFVVDSWIKICLKCSKDQKFKIDLSKSKNCLKCGETFIPIKSSVCPVCWRKKFEVEGKNGNNN